MGSNLKNNISRFIDSGIYKKINSTLSVIIILAYSFLIFKDLHLIYLVNLSVFTITFFFLINPLLIIISKAVKGEVIDKRQRIRLIITSLLIACFFCNIYNILFSGEEVLYISYKLAGISLLGFIIIVQYKKIREIVRDENKKNKGLAILGCNLYLVSYLLIFLFQSGEVFLEENMISLDDIKIPYTISLYQHDEKKSRNNLIDFINQDKIKIENKEVIDKLIKQLQGKKLENLRGISYIDYSLKTSGIYPYYTIFPSYNMNTGMRKDLEDGYINYIKLYNDGKVIISEFDHETREYQRYKTFISKELAKQIISLAN